MADDQIYRFIDAIKTKLFEPEERRLKAGIDRLVEQNEEILKDNMTRGFMFAGETYQHSESRMLYKSYPMLAWSLNEEMERWLKDRKAVNLDKDQIGQMLFRLLSHVMLGPDQLQETRDALPECLVPLVPVFQGMSRKFNTQFFLRSDRDFRQYAKILPKIEMYAMTRLIY
ncbi:hypothetical protein [Paraburkholderia sp. SIMBA_054]|uniref:hypothetical protein n=1 Tax=Paraburkholderia sp. SIMBA_054 TaxID=3085795 RepID=UPI00397D3FDD